MCCDLPSPKAACAIAFMHLDQGVNITMLGLLSCTFLYLHARKRLLYKQRLHVMYLLL
jgi:hypothetical protein